MVRCPNCTSKVSDEAEYCPDCGTQISPEFDCHNCGAELDPGVNHCPKCGAEITYSVPESSPHHPDNPLKNLEFVGSGDATSSKSNGKGHLIAGAILIAAGAILSISGVGVIIGVPLGMLGFAVMFPRFTTVIVILAILSFVILAL